MTDPTSTSPYLRAAARLRAQAALKLERRDKRKAKPDKPDKPPKAKKP